MLKYPNIFHKPVSKQGFIEALFSRNIDRKATVTRYI